MKNQLTKIAVATLAAGLVCGAPQVMAYEAGDIVVRAGYANVAPNDSSNGIALPVLGVAAIAGTKAEVDSGDALGLTLGYMLSPSLGLELLVASPFEHDITANLGGLGSVAAGSAKQLPPTLSVIWYPLAEGGSALQPYLGLGVNYTIFFEEDVSASLEAAAPAIIAALNGPAVAGPVPMKLNLDDSWGVAAQVGVDYALNEKWHLNASVRWMDIDTDARFSSALSGETITVSNVEVDPFVYQVNIGYTF